MDSNGCSFSGTQDVLSVSGINWVIVGMVFILFFF